MKSSGEQVLRWCKVTQTKLFKWFTVAMGNLGVAVCLIIVSTHAPMVTKGWIYRGLQKLCNKRFNM